MHVGYFRGSERIRASLEANGWEYDFLVTEGESLVTRARNGAVKVFMESAFDVLCFIDADIEVLDGQDLVDMLELDSPIRGAAVAMKTPDLSQALSAWRGSTRLTRAELLKARQPVYVDYLGAAVMAIDKSALEVLISRHPELAYDDPCGGTAHALFEPVLTGGAYLSEDYGFCALASQAGLKIEIAPQCTVRHYGAIFWRW